MSSAGVRELSRCKSNIVYRYSEGVRRAMNRPAGEVIQEVDPSDPEIRKFLGVDVESEFDRPLPDLAIPASGEAYEDCGEEQPLLFCSKCGRPKRVNRRCRRMKCRECWESGVKRAAVSVASKIEARKRYENTKHRAVHGEGYGTLRHHAIVSPPPGYWMRREDPLEASVEIVKLLLGEFGANEGAIIYHPWRIHPDHRGEVLGHESGDGDLQWKDILEMVEGVGWETVRNHLLVFEPHFHCFVLSDHFYGESAYIEDKTGWVVHRIEDESGASIRDLPDLCSAVAYSLSHAGLRESERGMDAQYWTFGETHNWEVTDGIEADVDRCFRAIAPEVLGTEFPELRCDGRPGASNEGASIAKGVMLPEEVEEVSEEVEEECRGVYLPMMKAGRYLVDEGWREGALYVTKLRKALREYHDLHSDRPPPEMDLPPIELD